MEPRSQRDPQQFWGEKDLGIRQSVFSLPTAWLPGYGPRILGLQRHPWGRWHIIRPSYFVLYA